MMFKYRCLLIISPLIVVADQCTKLWIRAAIPQQGSVTIIPGYFDLVHVMNTGAAFGMLAGAATQWRTIFFGGIAGVALIGIGFFLTRLDPRERLLPCIFSLVVGGIIGNIIDRLRFGAVTDFLSVHWRNTFVNWRWGPLHLHFPLEWPAFNIADSAITVSMLLLAWQVVKQR